MVQSALDDQDIFVATGEGQTPAIGDDTFCRTFILSDQTKGQIHPFEASESHAAERVEPIPAATKQFDDRGIAGPLVRAEFPQSPDEFLSLLLRGFEAQVGSFPGIRRPSGLGMLKWVASEFFRWPQFFGWQRKHFHQGGIKPKAVSHTLPFFSRRLVTYLGSLVTRGASVEDAGEAVTCKHVLELAAAI